MAGMYLQRAEIGEACNTRDLNQGDLLANVVRPVVPAALALTLVHNGNKLTDPRRVNDSDLPGALDAETLRVVLRVVKLPLCIVLSSSCDVAQGGDLLLAPVTDFKLGPDPVQNWTKISNAATSSANPKRFYLPDSPVYGFGRSEVLFPQLFVVSQEYLTRWVAQRVTRRVCGLTPEAQKHLQWTFTTCFSRNPREDLDWPSLEDLRLKKSWLEDAIVKGSPRQEENSVDLKAVEAEIERRIAELSTASTEVTKASVPG